jgi:hypothetical protein
VGCACPEKPSAASDGVVTRRIQALQRVSEQMIGVRSGLYARSTCCWSDRFRNAAPDLERLRPSRAAVRCNAALTMGFTQQVTFCASL